MSELAKINDIRQLVADNNITEEAANKIATSVSFIPSLRLGTSNSTAVKDEKVPMNTYFIAQKKDEYSIIGKTVDCLVFGSKNKALDTLNDIICIFDEESDEFARIKADSEVQDSRCSWGVEFLLWEPTTGMFCSMFLNSKTSRNEIPAFRSCISRWQSGETDLPSLTLASKNVKFSNGYKAQIITTIACEAVFDALPDSAAIKEALDKFSNEKPRFTEKAEGEGSGRAR